MSIIFSDGGILTCESIEVCGNVLIADDYRIVDLCEVERIEGSEEE